MPEINTFHGVDYFRAADKLGEDQCASGTNIDFSMVRGGAAIRKGSTRIANLGNGGLYLFRHYNAASASPWYVVDDTGNLLRITGGVSSPSIATSVSGFATGVDQPTAFGNFRNDAFFASASVAVRELDGTSVVDWIKTPPSGALALTTSTITALNVIATWTISEGITQGATTVDGGTGTATVTATVAEDTNRLVLYSQVLTSTNLNLNGTETIGDLGVHTIDLSFSDPKALDTLSIDYSIGGTTFDNYYHASINVVDARFDLDQKYQLNEGDANADALAYSVLDIAGDGIPPTVSEVNEARSVAIHRQRSRSQRISRAPDTFNTWSIPVTKFEIIGKAPDVGFGDVRAVRLVVESADSSLVVKARKWFVQGAETYPLNDPQVGYAYWETFGRIQTIDGVNALTEQSGPSPVSARIKVSGGRISITSTNTSTDSSLTHRIFYRQGGFMRDAYAIATVAIATATHIDTLGDIKALMQNYRMPRGLRSAVPADVRAIAQFRGRLFFAWDNKIGWSEPNNPGALPRNSWTDVSYEHDLVQALIPAGNTLVVVNRDTVYTLRGSVFEGLQQDWVLEKTAARGGSTAPRTVKATPFGILLVRDAGLFLYDPGAATDVPVTWAMEKIGDIFRGNGAADPAQQKGRLGGADQAAWRNATAAWYNDQLWLAYADDDSSASTNRPNRVAVLDFRTENAWIYQYPFEISDILNDPNENGLYAVTPDDGFMLLQNSLIDEGANGTSTGIVWNLRSRLWTTPSDAVAENLFVELDNASGVVCKAIFDGTDTDTLGTLAGSARDWYNPPLNGVFHHSVEFDLSGTAPSGSQGMLFGLHYDLLPEPKRVNYWRTPHEIAQYDGDKIWDVHFSDIEIIGTGNVLAPVFIDNTAVMTATIAGPTNGRIIYEKSFPVSTDGFATIGEVAYTTYTSVDPVEFKLWKTSYAARKEPPKMTEHQERITCDDEYLWRNYNLCVNPGGTMTHEFFVDGTSITTRTSGGTRKQSYAYEMPINTYGRTVIVIHRSVSGAFKFFESWWDRTREPDRVKNYQWYPASLPSDSFPKTLVTELDCLSATVLGTVYLDSTNIAVETFTGAGRQTYNRALDLNSSNLPWDGTRVEVDYTSSAVFKHYSSVMEFERKPFGKKEWSFSFRKIGGATRLDMGIDYSLDIEAEGTATITYAWDIDPGQFQTGTHVVVGRQWLDMQPLAPGMRSRLFRLRLWSPTDFHVYSAGLDLEREGRKGVSIVTAQGTPDASITMHNEEPMQQTGG